ncbi:poor Imd response upon knock-in [Carabus blaptoides fortunei]
MVVPMNKSATEGKMKRIVGDGKRIIMRTNSDSLLVIGSGNSVEVERNDGKIEVIGDGCRVSVTAGSGSIEYNGDGGYLRTGSMDMSKIIYNGDGGRVVSANGTTKSYNHNKCSSAENLREPRVTERNIYIKNKCHIKIPGLNKLCNINNGPVTKITVINCKCKHC